MPKRLTWDEAFNVGDEIIDAQHRRVLAQCNLVADQALPVTEESDRLFQQGLDALIGLMRQHFTTEEASLAGRGSPELEEYRHAREEFEYLAAEIATTENFDKLELQRFLALWLVGHILSDAKRASANEAMLLE
ncbi:MAG: bacteriohemerythrin [Ignavibacteria bacterium]